MTIRFTIPTLAWVLPLLGSALLGGFWMWQKFVMPFVQERVRRHHARQWAKEWEAKYGPIPPEDLEKVRASWPNER